MTAASRLRPRDPYADDPPEAARQRLIHRLITVVGDGLTRVAAQEVLEHARAWTGRSMRQLDQHFADHPDALADPDAHAPPCLARVAYRLIDIGVGQAVQPPRCVQCGLAKREMVRGHPHPDGAGRCCGACLRHLTEIDCVRCGRRGPRGARRAEGMICQRCYHHDPDRQITCVACGRLRPPSTLSTISLFPSRPIT